MSIASEAAKDEQVSRGDHDDQSPVIDESKKTSIRHFCVYALIPFMVTRFILLLIGVVTAYYIAPLVSKTQPIVLKARYPEILWQMWIRFDSGFFVETAKNGYWGADTLHGQSNWAFFPLYPLLMRAIAFPLGNSLNAYFFAGILISNVCIIVALYFLYKITAYEFNNSIAIRATVYVSVFPMSYFFSAVYSESLFFVLMLACIYYTRRRLWWVAGALGGLAALTRPLGVLLVIAMAWEYWQVLSERHAPFTVSANGFIENAKSWIYSRVMGIWKGLRSLQTWKEMPALALIPAGLGLFCLYGLIMVGTLTPFKIVEEYGWGRHFIIPLKFLKMVFTTPRPPDPYDWTFYGLNISVIVIFLLVLIPIFKKLPTIYGILAATLVIMPLCTTSTQSTARFYMLVFPLYMLLAWWSSRGDIDKQVMKHSSIIIFFAMLLGLATAMWTLGIYSMS